MAADSRLPLISFTGSTSVGRFNRHSHLPRLPSSHTVYRFLRRRSVGATVGKRLGRTILELGPAPRPTSSALFLDLIVLTSCKAATTLALSWTMLTWVWP